eukprot:403333912
MEDSESLSDLDLEVPPKLTFEEAKAQIFKDPKQLKHKKELLKAMYYYCKDQKKNSRVITLFFWPMIVSLIQDKDKNNQSVNNNNKISLFGLKILNSLIQEEGTNEEIMQSSLTQNKNHDQENIISILKEAKIATQEEIEADKKYYIDRMIVIMKHSQNPIRILKEKILNTDSTLIMNEATKALRNFSKTSGGIESLMSGDGTLLKIVRNKFLESDPLSQQYILEIISSACKFQQYRKELSQHEDFIEIVMSQVKSISTKVTYMTLKIFRQLAKDEQNLEHLQGEKLRLSHKLIYAFKWLDSKNNQDNNTSQIIQGGEILLGNNGGPNGGIDGQKQQYNGGKDLNQQQQDSPQINELDMIYREISKTFQYILKYYDIHQKLLNQAQQKQQTQGSTGENGFTESDIIDTIISLGKATNDPKTTLNAATSLAHITEILHCNEAVASQDAIEFMMDMLKDTKNIKHHRQGCRYFANLSFYSNHRNSLVQNKITAYLLGAIEADGLLDEDTIKHSAIALANLSSHKDFMTQTQKSGKGDIAQISKVERGKIKPLIHLLDSAQESKINLIQSACITLCNMASKPSLHQHFVQEPEISTIKNCLQNPIDKNFGNELTRFMIKLVCNLTKNPEILPQLSKKGFLEILFDLLNHEKEKEIFGNVVTAISYMSVLKECQEKIVKNKIMQKILDPIPMVHEVDQKLIIIALTSLLFNGYELQREFIKFKGLDTLIFFINQKEKIFQQLSCKCFSLLSENNENLQDILDQDCLSSIIISCLKTKDIDLETLKEVTKIFINLILWRKLKKDQIETTCYLCDIGFMIRDLDMNILAIFCLNSLSENEYSHQYIIKSCIDDGGNVEDLTQQSSIFSRMNFLLEQYEQYQKQDDKLQNETLKYELLVQLITSFYLNLSRNDDNIEFLLNLKLFKKLNSLMMINLQNQKIKATDSTALCYTNTVFGKLLKTASSRKQCIEEEGHKLFINILKNKQNEYLFLETLDSIKLFLTKREYLTKFHQIPSAMELSDTSPELNVSYLQVLAILSFEKENHKPLKEINFIEKVQKKKLFQQIFTSFNQLNQEQKKMKMKKQSQMIKKIKDHQFESEEGDLKKHKKNTKVKIDKEKNLELTLAVSILLANLSSDDDFIRNLLGIQKWKKKDKNKDDNANNSQIHQMLSSSYQQNSQMQSQMSDQTLSIHKEEIKQGDDSKDYADQNHPNQRMIRSSALHKQQNEMDGMSMHGGAGADGINTSRYTENEHHNLLNRPENQNINNLGSLIEEYYEDSKLEQIEEVKRMKDLLDLLSHENQFVTEQIAILLANVSNSPYFKQMFISPQSKRAMEKILKLDKKHKPTQVTLLAVLIGVLNLSSLKDLEKGNENLKFFQSLEEIIKNDQLPNVTKSIALLAISNIYTLSKSVSISHETRDFAFHVLQNWKQIADEHQQMQPQLLMDPSIQQQTLIQSNNQEQNNLLQQNTVQHTQQLAVQTYQQNMEIVKNLIYSSLILFYNIILKKPSKEIIKKLIQIITDNIISFNDSQIVNIMLELITLFTKEKEIALLVFKNMNLIEYTFEKLKSQNKETLKMSALALSRLAARLDEYNSEYFILNLKNFKDFDVVVDNINKMVNNEQMDTIMKYFLNFLENVSSFKKTRDELDCSKLYDSTILLYSDKIILENKVSLINIIFNLNFNLTEPRVLPKEFLKLLYKTYKDESMRDDQKTLRKIIVLIVSASALEDNHKNLIKSGFYTQFKKNINELYEKLIEANEEVELFGLVNIALNKKYMHLIYQDLKKIYKIALKNQKIDFKTKVDLFSECSKFLVKISQQSPEKNNVNVGGSANEKDISEMIDHCLKALLFCLIQLIQTMDDTQYPMFKYFLSAILETTKNLKNHLIILIKIDHLLDFLSLVLAKDFEFNMKDFDDQVLNFSLRIIDQIKLVVNFSQKMITMNIDKKMIVVSNTLRLLSQMIASIHAQPQAHEKVLKTNAVEFIKEAMTLSKDLQPCINIDALFCLTNMMNIKELALDPQILNQETVNNALIIYFAYNHQVELDECIITFLFSISKLTEYQILLKDKSKVLFFLMDKHLDASKGEGYKESCRKKIFSTIHNMTENEDVCKQLNVAKFIQLTNKMLSQTQQNLYSSDHIHELALKSLINMCRNTNEGFEEANLKELFSGISHLYSKFKSLAKQYSLRLITMLTKQWNAQKIEEYLVEIVDIISQFIERCDSMIEIRLALLNIERISFFKKLMIKLAEIQCDSLIMNISSFIKKSMEKDGYSTSIEQLIKFCKKFSKQSDSHQYLVAYKLHELSLEYITKYQSLNFTDITEKQLRQILTAIYNVMKLVKNLYEGGSITEAIKLDIFEKVSAKEEFIVMADNLLQSYQNNDELAIMIVNIIICFSSIQNKLDQNRVKGWISNFSARLIESCTPEIVRQQNLEKQDLILSKLSLLSKGNLVINQQTIRQERYLMIIEQLVIKNIDKIDKEITDDILRILEVDTTAFTKTIWFKIIKILGHLQYLQEITNQQMLESIFKFIITAYEKANEDLCFYYFVRVIIMIIKKVDNNALFRASKFYQIIFSSCVQFLKTHYKQKTDPLILEIMLYLVDFFKYLMNFSMLYTSLNNNEIINCFVEMLGIHDNISLVKGITSSLVEASKITVFFPDILNDQSLSIIFNKIINGTNVENKSLDNLSDCFKNILMQTKIPIKYLIASTLIKLTEPKSVWKDKEESNIVTVMKILQQVIKSLEDSKETVSSTNFQNQMDEENLDTFSELLRKSTKYSLIAITNILIKTNPEYIFNRRLSLAQLLIDYSGFDLDSQMNLRFLYLLYISIDKNVGKDLQPNTIQSLTSFLLTNLHKYSSVLHMKESYFYDIPSFKSQNMNFNQQLNMVHSNSVSTVLSHQIKPREASGQITVGILDNGNHTETNKIAKAHSSNITQQDLLNVQALGGLGSSSPSGSSQNSSSQNHTQYFDYYFFENEDAPLRKIDAIRFSLCMTIKILYKSASTKKKLNCQNILENELSGEIFKYLTQFIENGDNSVFRQVYQVVKIIQNCAEFIQLHQLILQKDSVFYLIKLAEKIVQIDDSNVQTFTQALNDQIHIDSADSYDLRKLQILTSILRTLMSLCTTSEFHWHLTKYNIMDLLSKIKEKEDTKINELVKEFWEKVIYHSNESTYLMAEQDFHTELLNIVHEPESRQIKVLQNIETILIQKKVKLDKFGNSELDVLLQILKQKLDAPDSSFETIQIKKIILNTMNFIYVNKFLKENTQPSILFQDQSLQDQLQLGNNQIENMGGQVFVASIIEKQEMLHLLAFMAQNQTVYMDLFEKIVELFNSYTQSKHIRDECLVEYVLPSFYKIVSFKEGVSVSIINTVLQCIIKLLKMEDTSHILLAQYDLPALLSQMILNQVAFQNDMFNTNLEIIVKLMYYSPEKVTESSEQFLINLITNQHSTELNRLGLFSLYCISLAIQEQNQIHNIFIFERDQILRGIFSFLSVRPRRSIDKQLSKEISQKQIGSQTPQNINAKLKQVALQIIINILELVTSDQCISDLNIAEDCAIIAQKIIMDFNFLTILTIICFNNEYTIEDRKLAARGFAATPFNILYKMNPLIFQKQQSNQLQNDTFTIQIFFQALVIIMKIGDNEGTYFALYTLFSFLHSLNFVQDLQVLQQSEQSSARNLMSLDQNSKAKLSQLDYPLMCSCLIKSELMQLVFMLPLKTDDEDIMRISMKLLILIIFKGQYSKLLLSQEQQNQQQLAQSTSKFKIDFSSFQIQLYEKLDIDIDSEIENGREQLNELIQKFQHFELTQINQSGYVQFLHLLSQIITVSTTSNSNNFLNNEERSKILPPPNVLAEIIIKSAILFQAEKETQRNLFQGDNNIRKQILYRHFYYNYLLSVTIPAIISHIHINMFHNTIDDNMKDIPDRIFKTLLGILEQFKDKNLNSQLDQLMLENYDDLDQEHQQMSSSKFKDKQENQEDDSQEDDHSTTLSIIRLIIFNISTLLKCSMAFMNDFYNFENKKFKQSKAFAPEFFQLTEHIFEMIINFLMDNEEDANIVETVYEIMDIFISVARGQSTHENVRVMEGSKILMSLAIKHTAIYQCEVSYYFLLKLTTVSEKYKGKPEVEKALQQIMPYHLKDDEQ